MIDKAEIEKYSQTCLANLLTPMQTLVDAFEMIKQIGDIFCF